MKRMWCALVFLPICMYGQVNVKTPSEVFDLLVNNWQYNTNPEFERWTKTGKEYRSTIYSVMNGDTTISEACRIFKEKNTWYFEQKIMLSTGFEPVRYELTAMESRMMRFENKTVVFPQAITYEFLENNYLRVSQSGLVRDKTETLQFLYRKYF